MSTAEVYDFPLTRRPLVPPCLPRASESISAIGRVVLMRDNMIATWGQHAYEDDIVQGRFFGRSCGCFFGRSFGRAACRRRSG